MRPNRILNKKAFFVFLISMLTMSPHAHAQEKRLQTTGQPISLYSGLSTVTKDSRLVQIEKLNTKMSFEDSVFALSGLLPHLRVTGSKTFQAYQPASKISGSTTYTQEKDPWSFGFDVYQTLFDFGKTISQYQASVKAYQAEKINYDVVKKMVELEFATAYFNTLEVEKLIDVAENEVKSIGAYLGDMEHLYEQGVIVKNDLLPARVKMADAKQKLIEAHNTRDVLAARLNTMLTYPARLKISVSDVEFIEPDVKSFEEALGIALVERPELKYLNDLIAAAEYGLRAKTAGNLPTVYLDTGYNYAQNKYQLHESNYFLMLGAKMDLYDGGATCAEVMKQRFLKEKLTEQKLKLEDDIEFEVMDSFTGLMNAREKVEVAKNVLEQSDENVRAYRVKYNNGAATSTDVLEAISLQTRAQTNFYSASYQYEKYRARLMHAMGTDLVDVYKQTEKK